MLKALKDDKLQQIKVAVNVSKEEWAKAQEDAKKALLKQVKVKGFRKGKVPSHIAEKNISPIQVLDRALNSISSKYIAEATNVALETKERIFDRPDLVPTKISEEELSFEFVYPLMVNLSQIKLDNLKTKYKVEKFKESMVDDMVKETLSKQSVMLPKEGESALGDVVLIDFKGFINDEAFEGGEAEKFELTLGSGQFIPGFEDQLVGKSAGWEGDVVVTFPAEYYVKDFRNKEAVFQVKIHSISKLDIPELTEENVFLFGIPNVKTVEELRNALADIVKQRLSEQAKSKFLGELIDEIIAKNPFNINDRIVESKVTELNNNFNQTLKQQGIKRHEYLAVTKSSEEDIHEEMKKAAIAELSKAFVYNELKNRFKPEPVAAEAIEAEYERIAKLYNMDVNMIKGFIQENAIVSRLSEDAFVDKIIQELGTKK
ncbi:trigger factor [Mycoplasmopsis pullorum]|uniref:trigger factor n=1 Tax=Mycoplasmopsis pullorum TaxID=48003 RepID=UPI0015D605C9|nr:trigger factor [Mycoplasmopsis pullorum]